MDWTSRSAGLRQRRSVLTPEDDDDRVRTAQRNVDLGRPDGLAPGRGFNAYLPQPRHLGLRVAVNVG